MALIRQTPDLDRFMTLARGSWARDELDATWRATGWPAPAGGSVSRAIFDHMDYIFGPAYEVMVAMRFDPDAVRGFSLTYAVFSHPDEDPDVAAELGEGREDWTAEPEAGRPRFDEAWREATAALGRRLGPPTATGRHDPESSYALWRSDRRLIVNSQGEDFPSYSSYDAACLWVIDHDPAAPLPTGMALYDLLVG